MQTIIHGAANPTLKDRLSRLSHLRACALLGPQGSKLIQLGGAREIDLACDVTLSEDAFTLALAKAVVTIALDKAAALALPIHAFDACIREFKNTDKYQTVAFDSNRYSVPRRWAFQAVTVKAYVDHIEIVANH